MSKNAGTALSVLSIIAIVLSIAACVVSLKSSEKETEEADIRYVMYLGTNDKDSNQPV